MHNFTNFNKNSKSLARNTTHIFPQVLTHNNITKMSRKLSRTCKNFLGIFNKIFEHIGVQTARNSDENSKKNKDNARNPNQSPGPRKVDPGSTGNQQRPLD
jgi:hypothetical protein